MIIAILAVTAVGSTATAQRLTRIAVIQPVSASPRRPTVVFVGDTAGSYGTALPRALLGIGGAVAGLYIGAELSGLDSPIEDAATGTFVGALVGAAIGAGAWPGGSSCHAPKRLARSVVGSVLGGLIGAIVGIPGGGAGLVMGLSAGAGIGAGVGASGCDQ